MTACERYAKIRKALRDSRKQVLKDNDLNEDTLKALEQDALDELGEESEKDTEHGKLLVNAKPYFAHHDSKLMGYTRFLTFKED